AYPSGDWGPHADNWRAAQRHASNLEQGQHGLRVNRTLDNQRYTVDVFTTGALRRQKAPHTFVIGAPREESLEAVFAFAAGHAGEPGDSLGFRGVQQASREHWAAYWNAGGVVDFSRSSDPRWRELERRAVLSQYLTAIQCAGSMPPQETGLLCNSWHGKSHLEMHWWHAAHFSLWGRHELLERSLGWYEEVLPAARAIAQRQGYAGVRWPKMTGPRGVSSPSDVGELLIWQQPHPIYFAELAYRRHRDRETLERYRTIVEQTADFMADYAYFDQASGRYALGPVLIPAQECYEGRSAAGVLNPTFELAYWRWALRAAGAWRERLGLPRNDKWYDVAERITTPHQRDGVYTAIANPPFTRRRDHPSMLAALGVLPDVGLIDRSVMLRTLEDVNADWQWETTWGWDYPMMAMTAARLGRGDLAVDYLLRDSPKNRYLPNGHCFQENRLPVYLPANGGLLSAIALMAAGWDSEAPLRDAPGFPQDGGWIVQHEGLSRMP
ncbi:MAG: hypothetical protein KDA37_06620, partial [Planctomycetales bacterium]|nr:hypothetical protein [Planctomycetales bacterium]